MKASYVVTPHDPGEWPVVITDKVQRILVERGPEQVTDFNFPSNVEGRKFNVRCYCRRMCNGQGSYSLMVNLFHYKKNVIFCFCCSLFDFVQMSLSSASGYSDWKHMYEQLSAHEKSPNHMRAYQLWMDFSKRVRLGRTENQRVIKMEVERWREVFKRLVYVIEFLFPKFGVERKEGCII
ncbi:Zinc finger MYM-type protein 5 [Araneus ventricosus]|uniref:Zinc finger MYM-type protein 5 n=1 Tax=Araneus ventricosus TaxID=182803 RepID=A0A4Y2I1M9_ARAVE|nr:Zinc finger MYM-type protein 5 [Araneus ventricosus]